jgi:hypothetical protein
MLSAEDNANAYLLRTSPFGSDLKTINESADE